MREDYAFFDVSREMDPRASSGKILRVKSRYPESFRFLGLCPPPYGQCPNAFYAIYFGASLTWLYHRFKDMSNVTPWSELKDMDVTWQKGGVAISEEQAKAMGAGDLVLR